jgi:hypothetical protein
MIEAGDNMQLSLLRGPYDLRRGWTAYPRWVNSLKKSLYLSYIWTSTGFLIEVPGVSSTIY